MFFSPPADTVIEPLPGLEDLAQTTSKQMLCGDYLEGNFEWDVSNTFGSQL